MSFLSKSHSKWPTHGFWEVRWYAWWRGPRCIRVLAGVGLSWCSSGLPLVHLDYPICAWIREPWPLMSHRGTHLPSRPLVAVPLDVSSAGFAFRLFLRFCLLLSFRPSTCSFLHHPWIVYCQGWCIKVWIAGRGFSAFSVFW